jgi:type IV pilus assembly protein PilE
MMPTAPRSHLGFTLIEVMVTVAIVGILAAIALPAYKEQIARGKRADVQTVLMEDAGYMQRYYAAQNSFNGTPAPSLPASQAPKAAVAANYTIAVAVPASAPVTFTLTATRAGSMVGDKCGNFTYDNLGQKGLAAGTAAAGQTAAACWR